LQAFKARWAARSGDKIEPPIVSKVRRRLRKLGEEACLSVQPSLGMIEMGPFLSIDRYIDHRLSLFLLPLRIS
jgi:hypothetical protein